MKKLNKIFALMLALLMLTSLAVSAAAEEPSAQAATYTITIDNPLSGRTYEGYQIFTGNISDAGMVHIEWGTGVTDAGQAALRAAYSADDAQALARKIVDEDDAKEFAKQVSAYLQDGKKFTYDSTNKNYTLSGLEEGYYLVKDTTVLGGQNDAVSAYIMHVAKNVTVSPKTNIPTIEKKVSDINDSDNMEYINLQDTADHDIGDNVPFHVHVKLGNDISYYTSYKLVVTDTMSKGLTFNENSLKVMFGSFVLDAKNYTVATTTGTDGSAVITITFDDLFKLVDKDGNPLKDGAGAYVVPQDGGNLVLEYTARLNDNAVIGSQGNPNTVYMEYSNDPYSNSMGKSQENTVIVFTYQLDVNKTDGNKALEGAAFALYKNDFDGKWNLVKEYTVTAGQTTFSFTGLDDGEYKLVETVTPAGYNKIEDQIFNIVASHDNATLKLTDLNGEKITGTIELTHNVDEGKLSTDIVNEKGALLPSTGGIGTTVFYVLGGILVCGAIVLLITKKRMSAEV